MALPQQVEFEAEGKRPPPRAFGGWALGRALELDEKHPGLLAAIFRFGVQRRQAAFLVMAFVELFGAEEIAVHVRASGIVPGGEEAASPVVLGEAILHTRRPRDLVGSILSGPPDGLLGTLRRLGPDPVGEPKVYYEIARLFLSRDPGDRRRAKTLMQIEGKLVGAQVEIVSALDPVLLHPALVATLHEVEEVEQLHHALAFLRANAAWADDEAVRVSLGRLRRDNHRGDLIRYWASRFDRLPCPLDVGGDPTLVVLTSAAMMIDAARRYRNCLKNKIGEAFLGAVAIVEYRPADTAEPGVIAELRWTTSGYLLLGMYAADNRRVRDDRADLVRRKLLACGVALLGHAPGDPAMIRATARMLGQWALGEPDNDAFGLEPLDAVVSLQQALAEVA